FDTDRPNVIRERLRRRRERNRAFDRQSLRGAANTLNLSERGVDEDAIDVEQAQLHRELRPSLLEATTRLDRRLTSRAVGAGAMQLRFRERLAELTFDNVENPTGPGREAEHGPPQIELHLLDVARGLELLLRPQYVEFRHVAEVHRQEARRL